jgi:tRNA(fMet)-specific endonuclease VapC
MHLLDTDTLTHLHLGHAEVVRRLREVGEADVGITVITRIEVLQGRFAGLLKAATTDEFLRAQARLLLTEELLARLTVIWLDETALDHFQRIRAARGLKRLGRADLLIASIALSHRATLVTRNVQHFQRIPDLRVVNWVD